MSNEKIESWLTGPFDPETKAEIKRQRKEDPNALSDAFFKDLVFGTGGMRAVMGVGTNRMNIYTVQMATQGLANAINKTNPKNPSVFIGFDTRNHSKEFALEAAKVFSGNGIRALISKEICPTPLVSFACRHFHCKAAVMITASHNPPEYNGYKVYWEDGAQVVPPNDKEIIDEVRKIKSPVQVKLGSSFEEIDAKIDDAYLKELKKMQLLPEAATTSLKIIYTNLHGTGIRLVPKALKSWGYEDVHLVEKQKTLDGNFPYAHSPNPEEDKALQMGTEMLIKEKADLLIATDPDADRIGIVADGMRFSGNQMACLCLEHLCTTLQSQGKFPKNGAAVKTIVTTELFQKIATSHGLKCFDVLTGFKYIAELIGNWEKKPDGYQYIFGAEESYGCLFNSFVRDKDAVSAACLIAEVAAKAKQEGKTLKIKMDEIYQKHGVHLESLINLKFSESELGMNQMKALMESLRKNPPKEIGGKAIEKMEDFSPGLNGLPPSNVLRFWLKDGSKIVIRPSGTEPKVKIYIEVTASSTQIADQRLKQLQEVCEQKFDSKRSQNPP